MIEQKDNPKFIDEMVDAFRDAITQTIEQGSDTCAFDYVGVAIPGLIADEKPVDGTKCTCVVLLRLTDDAYQLLNGVEMLRQGAELNGMKVGPKAVHKKVD